MEARVSELGYLFSSLLTILHGANKLPSQISNFLTCKIIASFTLFLNFLFTLYKLWLMLIILLLMEASVEDMSPLSYLNSLSHGSQCFTALNSTHKFMIVTYWTLSTCIWMTATHPRFSVHGIGSPNSFPHPPSTIIPISEGQLLPVALAQNLKLSLALSPRNVHPNYQQKAHSPFLI